MDRAVELNCGPGQRHSRAGTIADGMAAYNTESRSVEVVNTGESGTYLEPRLGDPLLAQPALSEGRLFSACRTQGNTVPVRSARAMGVRFGRPTLTAPVVCGGAVYLSSFDGAVCCFDASNW